MRVLGEVDRYLATQVPLPQQIVRETSGEVQKVAELYKGKTMVLIGGDRRPHAYEALKSAFGLKELIWIATREHESTDIFMPYISRSDVDVVLLAIRWSSHSYGDVKDHLRQVRQGVLPAARRLQPQPGGPSDPSTAGREGRVRKCARMPEPVLHLSAASC